MDYLKNINTPKLQDNDIGCCEGKLTLKECCKGKLTLKECCEGKLTLKECWDALNSMKNNKSLGNDGFTEEFNVCFFRGLGSILI